MIKYLGSKRTLAPQIVALAQAALGHGARPIGTALDLFSGTSRVGHALKAAGFAVTANDHNAYAATLARCYVQSDDDRADEAARLIAELNGLPGRAGYVTETFCRQSRFFRPENGERIDAVRDAIAGKSLDGDLEAILLTSLMEAADRVDATVGVQMAYLKQYPPRALKPLTLRLPALLPRAPSGPGRALCSDALAAARACPADVAYLDPPYNQHSYLGNYHIWETLTRWDAPGTYGIARKREDVRSRTSRFNSRTQFAAALEELLGAVEARVIILSFSDEGFIAREDIEPLLARTHPGRPLQVVEVDYKRYVGAQIGIHNPAGERVGKVSHLRNKEVLYVLREDSRAPAGRSAAIGARTLDRFIGPAVGAPAAPQPGRPGRPKSPRAPAPPAG